MRQIPKYGIIGSGRLKSHLSHYFSLSNIPFNTWSRKENSSEDFASFADKSDVIILLIKDDAIEAFIDQNPILKGKILIHFSGSLTTEKAIGMHPLMSFSEKLFELETYQKLVFITEEPVDFKQIFPSLKNQSHSIKKEDKAYYHALCVMSGNFTSILWAKLFSELEAKLKIPKEAAFPYLKSICDNLIHDYKNALTGPLIRKDIKTIDHNLDSLSKDDFLPIYEAFYQVFLGEKL